MAASVVRFNATLSRSHVSLSSPVASQLPSPIALAKLAPRRIARLTPHRSLSRARTVAACSLPGCSRKGTGPGWSSSRWPSRDFVWHQQRSLASKLDPGSESDAGGHSPAPSTPPNPSSTSTSKPTPLPRPFLARPHEYIWTLPNILTFSRLASAPLIGYFILTSQPGAALSLFAYAAVTDGLDGYIARHWHQQTVVGTVIDPMADKALMTISVVALAMQHIIPPWLAVIILGRDVALSFTAFYYRWISLPPPKTMARYWDFSLPSAEVRPTEISKWNTFLQLLLVGVGMTMPVLPEALVAAWQLNQGFEVFQYVVAGTTVWSGASYLYSKDAVKILTQEEIEQRMKEREAREGTKDKGNT